jgi:AbrB family looped-hinge helix DNA binding protein
MRIEYVTVKSNREILIPANIRRKFKIREGTRIPFLEEKGRLRLQPITDELSDGISGILAGRGLPARIERNRERKLR